MYELYFPEHKKALRERLTSRLKISRNQSLILQLLSSSSFEWTLINMRFQIGKVS